MPSWIESVREYSKQNGGKWLVPRKGTPEYEAITAIMRGGAAAAPAESKAEAETRKRKASEKAAKEMSDAAAAQMPPVKPRVSKKALLAQQLEATVAQREAMAKADEEAKAAAQAAKVAEAAAKAANRPEACAPTASIKSIGTEVPKKAKSKPAAMAAPIKKRAPKAAAAVAKAGDAVTVQFA